MSENTLPQSDGVFSYTHIICQTCTRKFRYPKGWNKTPFCSDECRKKNSCPNYAASPSGVPDGFYNSKRRRKMLRGDFIDRVAVFEHYEWRCHICHSTIDQRLSCPSPHAATLDHVIPLSKNGAHVWENVVPAHKRCNEEKSDTTDGC